MTARAIPEGYHTITSYFSVRDASRLVEFLKQAFDAEEAEMLRMPDGTIMHAALRVGDSMVMIGQVPKDTEENKLLRAMLYLYVNDVDAVFKKAVQAGGKSIMEPIDQFYGDRSGAVEDSAGNQWWIATHKEDVSEEEMLNRASQRK
ncbi:MAG TPA: VOC family protein [Terriglobia bacterium]|nr:VOC family protein [Terriglobia bacterium]